jgi:hypothetical protein
MRKVQMASLNDVEDYISLAKLTRKAYKINILEYRYI